MSEYEPESEIETLRAENAKLRQDLKEMNDKFLEGICND